MRSFAFAGTADPVTAPARAALAAAGDCTGAVAKGHTGEGRAPVFGKVVVP
ncbi:hypothetical protein [Streptomyces sp. NPDC095817]|uniref:hypothetical protein n=1 Tax=unclassified Streptomyces TaxID=2593676 RepID=UPI00331FDE00